MQNCKATTKTGAACRAPAGEAGLCYLHAHPENAKTLGQIGGRKNRRSAVDLEVPDNMTAADLSKVTVQAMRLLFSGQLGAREVSAFAQLCNSWHRIIPAADLETRVATLERQIAEEGQVTHQAGGIAPDSNSTNSPTDQTEAAENNETVEAEQEGPCAVATMEDGEEAQGTSDGSNESEEP